MSVCIRRSGELYDGDSGETIALVVVLNKIGTGFLRSDEVCVCVCVNGGEGRVRCFGSSTHMGRSVARAFPDRGKKTNASRAR